MISLIAPVRTAAHGWPAGAKMAALCVLTMVLFAVQSLLWHGVFLAVLLGVYALPGWVFLRYGLARLRPLWPFVALIGVWHVFMGSMAEGAVVVLRMVTAVGLANLVTMTTKLTDIMAVVHRLLTPLRWFGVDTRGIGVAMALVVRFTPVLAGKGKTLSLAWRARSRKRVGWRILVPFAVLAIDDAEHVAEALRARGGL